MYLCQECAPVPFADSFGRSLGLCECCGFEKTCFFGERATPGHKCPIDHPANWEAKAARDKERAERRP